MVRIGVEDGHHVCTILLHLWNYHLLPLELTGLECDPRHIILRFIFSNRTQKFLVVPILFLGKIFQGMHYRRTVVSILIDYDYNCGGVCSYVIP